MTQRIRFLPSASVLISLSMLACAMASPSGLDAADASVIADAGEDLTTDPVSDPAADASEERSDIELGLGDTGVGPADPPQLDSTSDVPEDGENDPDLDEPADTPGDLSRDSSTDPSTDPSDDGSADVSHDVLNDVESDSSEPNRCGDIEAEYSARIAGAATCEVDEACDVLRSHCGVGLGGCYAASNVALAQEVVDEIAARWVELGCAEGRPICRCAAPPPVVCGVRGVCELAF